MTIEETVTVESFKDAADRMRQIGAEWPTVCTDCLYDAVNTVLRSRIREKTPQSDRSNPIYRTADGKNVLPSLRYKIGQQNLRKDLDFHGVTRMNDGSLRIGFPSVGYAGYVHEMTGAVNWSEPGTGAKYLDRPVKDNLDLVGDETANNIDSVLKKKGLT